MGVETRHYVFVGKKLNMADYDSLFGEDGDGCWDFFEQLEEDTGIDVVYDGMGGEYIMVGRIIDSGEDSEPMNTVLGLVDIQECVSETMRILTDLPGAFPVSFYICPTEIHIFTHYR